MLGELLISSVSTPKVPSKAEPRCQRGSGTLREEWLLILGHLSGSLQKNPWSPADRRWWGSIDLTKLANSLTHLVMVVVLQFPEVVLPAAPTQRGSLMSSHAKSEDLSLRAETMNLMYV